MTINDFQLEKGFRFNKSLNHLNNYYICKQIKLNHYEKTNDHFVTWFILPQHFL